jgi:hypothetical protein
MAFSFPSITKDTTPEQMIFNLGHYFVMADQD